ncbi:hypothetical protein ACFQ1Q_07810 [Winogradskyella litorisediminis]|uniref:Uncharacterized protein n=1 Tax=Winogradskyella litorisediminis TaxID=1156618 RepID=A0ABW3N846_9FLAO
MELVVNTFETEPLPESKTSFDFTNEPLLNSNYKAAARQNLINSKKPSVYGMRNRLKFKQFNSVNAIGVALKLSVFIIAVTMIF